MNPKQCDGEIMNEIEIAPWVIEVRVEGMAESMKIRVTEPITVGRADSSGTYKPDIDLGPYGGESKGVSRRHLILHADDDALFVTDLKSGNGTMLNGMRLESEKPYVLKYEDELQLGHLILGVKVIVSPNQGSVSQKQKDIELGTAEYQGNGEHGDHVAAEALFPSCHGCDKRGQADDKQYIRNIGTNDIADCNARRTAQRRIHRLAGVERAVRVLKHHLHDARQGPGFVRISFDLVERDRTAPSADQARQHAQHGGLAASRFPDQPEGLPVPHHETRVADGGDLLGAGAEGDGEILDLDHGAPAQAGSRGATWSSVLVSSRRGIAPSKLRV